MPVIWRLAIDIYRFLEVSLSLASVRCINFSISFVCFFHCTFRFFLARSSSWRCLFVHQLQDLPRGSESCAAIGCLLVRHCWAVLQWIVSLVVPAPCFQSEALYCAPVRSSRKSSLRQTSIFFAALCDL